ncbi:MAG TPA: penicillin-binding transpeptidase domain-containing protein, partial [Hyphomicrobiaceae bacterium]|nr:penicillin-binding transpeptidase domain-containing protein [Hyphomicrobiaceae bacterium]
MAYSHHDNEAHRMQRHAEQKQLKSAAARVLVVGVGLVVAFGAVSVQLVRLAARGQVDVQLAAAAPLTTSFSRPDIIDRHGRILATDVAAPSLYADPKNVLSVDETMERLSVLLPGIDTPELREILADKSRRFVWVKRRLSTALAQKIHELGLPGLVFRAEPQRSYPQARVAGHILGLVNIYNKGLSGLEHYIDEELGVERVPVARVNTKPPVRLSIDIPAQYALEQELQSARRMYRAKAASGVVLDVATGEVAAAASVPGVDPALAEEVLAKRRINRFANDVFELGSVFKTVTVAMAVELRLAGLDTIVDTTRPLTAGPFTIKDYHPAGRPLTVREV